MFKLLTHRSGEILLPHNDRELQDSKGVGSCWARQHAWQELMECMPSTWMAPITTEKMSSNAKYCRSPAARWLCLANVF